jgi:hypothetical protein
VHKREFPDFISFMNICGLEISIVTLTWLPPESPFIKRKGKAIPITDVKAATFL